MPKITQTTATPFESIELSGQVTVGEESAKRLSKVLGREVKVGETFDLGLLAYYNKNPRKSFWQNFKLSRKKHLFS